LGQELKLTPQGVKNPTGDLGYYWFSSWKTAKDTVKTETGPGDGSWTVSAPVAIGTYSITAGAFAEDYYGSTCEKSFTVVDASLNGTQTYELVAADSVIVGDVTLTIRDGYLTIDYTLKGGDAIRVNLEFFTVLNRINDLSTYEPESLMSMKINRNQAINLNEMFPGDTHLVLYFCSRCSVRNNPAFRSLAYNSTPHRALLSQMMALMD
jgi:hypothetical protein